MTKTTTLTLLDGEEWTFAELPFTRTNAARMQRIFSSDFTAFFEMVEESLRANGNEQDVIDNLVESGALPSPFKEEDRELFQKLLRAFRGAE